MKENEKTFIAAPLALLKHTTEQDRGFVDANP
jgi:hypothetical protein